MWSEPASGHLGLGLVPEREESRRSQTSQSGEVDSGSHWLPGLMAHRCSSASTRVVFLEKFTHFMLE